MDVHGRSALVTGGASGLGRATALRLAAAGALVSVADLAEPEGPEELSEAGILVQRTDVLDSAAVAASKAGVAGLTLPLARDSRASGSGS